LATYKIVWHKVFSYQYRHLEKESLLRRQVDQQLKVIASNPETAGTPLRYLPSDLTGKIKRLWVGGRKKYRMIIKVDSNAKTIKIGFIYPRLRKDLSYGDLPLDVFELPKDEIDDKKLKKFKIM